MTADGSNISSRTDLLTMNHTARAALVENESPPDRRKAWPGRQRRLRRQLHDSSDIVAALFPSTSTIPNHEVIDIPLHDIETLPPYQRPANRKIVVITCAAASDQAVLDIRAQLSQSPHHNSTHQEEQQRNGTNNPSKYYQFVGFGVLRNHEKGKGQPLALIQLATPTTAYLFRLRFADMTVQYSPMTESLRCLLSDNNIIKIGSTGDHSNVRDLNLVYGSRCCGDGTSFLSIVSVVKHRWPKLQLSGLGNLTAKLLRYRLHNGYKNYKEVQAIDWEILRMTPEMEEYAASVAFVALDLLAVTRTISDQDMQEVQPITEITTAMASVIMKNRSKAAAPECTLVIKREEVQKVQPNHENTITTSPHLNNMLEAAVIKCTRGVQGEEVVNVSKHESKALPFYQLAKNRTIVVITCAAESEQAVSDIRNELLHVQREHQKSAEHLLFDAYQFIGFDMLRKQQRKPGHDPVLLQLATDTTSYLFRLRYDGMPMKASLQSLLSDQNIVKVGARIHGDVQTLNRVYGNDCCGDGASFLDVVPLAKLRWPVVKGEGVRNFALAVLHCKLHKNPKWEQWQLSNVTTIMKERAAADSFVVLDLFVAMFVAILMPSSSAPPPMQNAPPSAEHAIQPVVYTLSDGSSPKQMRKILEQHIRGIRDLEVVDFPKQDIGKALPRYCRPESRNIVVITCASASRQAVLDIRNELSLAKQRQEEDGDLIFNSFQFVGVDTETRPSFNKGSRGNPPALLQIATFTTAYLFRLKWKGRDKKDHPMTESLRSLLSDPTIIKIGSGIHEDVKALNRKYGDKCCGDGSSFLDLLPLARNRWPKLARCGLRNLTATVLHHNLCKKQQMANWEKEVMTNPMIEYAAADSFVALDLLAAIVVQFDGYFITIEKNEAVTDDEKKCDDPRHDCESLSEENYSAKLIL